MDGLLAEQGLLGWISKHVCDYFLCMMYLKYCLEYLFLNHLVTFQKKPKQTKNPNKPNQTKNNNKTKWNLLDLKVFVSILLQQLSIFVS